MENYIHGRSIDKNGKITPTYSTWRDMKQRCLNIKHKDYYNYGARGIAVCDRWMTFKNFLEDMGERPEGLSLDRIENSQGYYKENCRWATTFEQNNNKVNTVYYTFNDETLTFAQWGRRYNIRGKILYLRITKYKWNAEKAFNTPPRRKTLSKKLNHK